jgi:hypothetical protein
MARYRLRGFTFTPTEQGGLVIDAEQHSLHLGEDELFELLAAIGLSADQVEELDSFSDDKLDASLECSDDDTDL